MSITAMDPSERAAWARSLGVSRAAIDLYLASEVVDLHLDSFIWTRVFGYDVTREHGPGLLGARLFSQADIPRLQAAHLGGALWSITTNPLRSAQGRARVFSKNADRLSAILAGQKDKITIVRDLREYREARARGRMAAFMTIQGGHALSSSQALDELDHTPVLAVTLLHLTSSCLGATSSPLRLLSRQRGLSSFGIEYVQRLDAKRIFVDLAHINREGFFAAVSAHDNSLPLLVSHTGVSGVYPHWRNLDDEQLRAIAGTGGVVGVLYHGAFLGRSLRRGHASLIVSHLRHIIRTVGDGVAALGSDWDGNIVTPCDMPTCLELPRLVQLMLEQGFRDEQIVGILGGNFLRALEQLRPEAQATPPA